MPTAIILLRIDRKKITGTAEKLLDMPAVTDVYSISGRYDFSKGEPDFEGRVYSKNGGLACGFLVGNRFVDKFRRECCRLFPW